MLGVEFNLPKNVEVLIPISVNVTLFGNNVFSEDLVKVSAFGWVLVQHDCFFIKGENLDRGKFEQREYGADIGKMPSTNEECQTMRANHQKLGEKYETFSPMGLRKNKVSTLLPQTFTSTLLASRIVRQ